MPVHYDSKHHNYFVRTQFKHKQYRLYTDPKTGHPFTSKVDAAKAEVELLASLGDRDTVTKNQTSCEDVFEPFLESLPQRLKPSTVYGHELLFKKYVAPAFKGYMISELRNPDLERINSQINTKDHKANINSTIATAKDFVRYLGRINPYISPDRMFVFKRFVPNTHVYHIWDREQETKFLNGIEEPKYKLLFTLLADYGFRISEVLALRYEDIDLDNNTISVKRILVVKNKEKRQMFTTPKTRNSIRTLQLLSEVKALLNPEQRTGYLFEGKNAEVIGQTPVVKANKRFAKKAGLEPLKLHEFRHSCASNLLKAGIPVRVVARWLGDTEATVMTFYSHLFPDEKEIVGEWMEKHPCLTLNERGA